MADKTTGGLPAVKEAAIGASPALRTCMTIPSSPWSSRGRPGR